MKKILLILIVLSLNMSYTEGYEQALKAININYKIDSYRQSIYTKIDENEPTNLAIEHKIKEIAKKLNTQPEYLKIIIYVESRFNPKAINKRTNAVGLIQFMPSTLKGLGLNYNDVMHMNTIQQLNVVYKYFKAYNYNYNSPYSLWLTVFYPYAIKKLNQDSYVFGSEKSNSYARYLCRSNKGFDMNKDGYITMKEYKMYYSLLFERLAK